VFAGLVKFGKLLDEEPELDDGLELCQTACPKPFSVLAISSMAIKPISDLDLPIHKDIRLASPTPYFEISEPICYLKIYLRVKPGSKLGFYFL
jgi:hypothetical protein